VTREHPKTGADEFLVFDVPGHPEFTAIVPGGGIEEGEAVEETAVREVKEETGLEVEFVRRLGVVEAAHYVEARPAGSTRDTWEHEDVVCRWLPVSPDVEVWGLRGMFIQALVRKRVVGYVTRGRELLVIDHKGMPDVPTQVPAGRVDSHESLEDGLRREVAEETGVSVRVARELAGPEEFARLYGPGAHESHAFHAIAEPGGPDEWEHPVTGSGMDAGLVYVCRWVLLDDCPPLWGDRDPLVEKLRRSITEE
jgi:ADP-ribose pyrophosphatase YjhB (NUDIX family)